MSIAGHVSRAMLSRYSHVRMEAKRRALDEIAARQRAAEERSRKETDHRVLAELSAHKGRAVNRQPTYYRRRGLNCSPADVVFGRHPRGTGPGLRQRRDLDVVPACDLRPV